MLKMMKRCGLLLALAVLPSLGLFAQSAPQEPENHAVVVERLMRYHDTGEYDREIRDVANSARDYLDTVVKAAPKSDKLAAIFDIDETSLSNWTAMSSCGLCSYAVQAKLYPDAHGAAIVPVLELYNFAKTKGVAVFFLTGRSESERDDTAKNLSEAGYSGWTDLVMRPNDNKLPASVFKPGSRQAITDKGYRIVLNIGDQASDLAGCCAERTFKIPNPFYIVK